MKLIEKKCPNCGANLEFGDNDKSCKCQYCHRAFEIERDTSLNVADIAEQFNLSEFKETAGTAAKVIGGVVIGQYIMAGLLALAAFTVFGIIGYNVVKSINNESETSVSGKKGYIQDVKDISNMEFSFLDTTASMEISTKSDNTGDFHNDLFPQRQKVYLMAKTDANILIAIYKVKYTSLDGEKTFTVYTPIKYENIKNTSDFTNGTVLGEEVYFNEEKTQYAYGYMDLDTIYEKEVKQYEKDYKITEK